MPNLSDYLSDTTALLRDANYQFNSPTQLTRYVNLARDQVAKQTGCLRALVAGQAPYGNSSNPGSLIPGAGQPGSPNFQQFCTLSGVEKYSFGYANPFLKANYQGMRSVVDVIDVGASWGGYRPVLNWLPWEDMQAYCRSIAIGMFSYPFIWSTNGSGSKGQVWLFPVPTTLATGQVLSGATNSAESGEFEWDCTCLPSYLYTNNDYEALPDSVTDAVPFMAAHYAFLGSQRFSMAAVMKGLYEERLEISNVAGDRGKTDSFYDGG